MGSSWFPEGTDVELHVDNPGYGEIVVVGWDGDTGRWVKQLLGEDVGLFLDQITSMALGEPVNRASLVVDQIGPSKAKALLRAVQHAVVLAGSGTERMDRLFRDPDEPPPAPFCQRCQEGTMFTSTKTVSEYCEENGHTAFGSDPNGTWESALQTYQWTRDLWDRKQRRMREDEEFAARIQALRGSGPGGGNIRE